MAEPYQGHNKFPLNERWFCHWSKTKKGFTRVPNRVTRSNSSSPLDLKYASAFCHVISGDGRSTDFALDLKPSLLPVNTGYAGAPACLGHPRSKNINAISKKKKKTLANNKKNPKNMSM